jgi:hypothetical protein
LTNPAGEASRLRQGRKLLSIRRFYVG